MQGRRAPTDLHLWSPTSWTDEELAGVLLSQLWRYYDAGGKSEGRAFDCAMLEPSVRLWNMLHSTSERTLAGLLRLSHKKTHKNFGQRTLNELVSSLARNGVIWPVDGV